MKTLSLLLSICGLLWTTASVPGQEVRPRPGKTKTTAIETRPGSPAAQAGERQGKQGKQGQDKDKPGRKAPSGKQETPRRRALASIAQSFPRTRSLLSALDRTAPKLLDQLLARVETLARRREQAALRMAREHHPELAKLLQVSRRRNPKAFASGMRSLLADYDRIVRARVAGEADHEAALEEWRSLSQARLLGAQVNAVNQGDLLPKIEALLRRAQTARRRQLALQVKRHQEQIRRLQRRLKQDPEQVVRRQLRAIQKRINNNRSRRSGDASKRRRK